MTEILNAEFEFTAKWFSGVRSIWEGLFAKEKPKKILEVGSFEGASACYIIETLGARYPVELHCVDTWEGGVEHKPGGRYEKTMTAVEARFLKNTDLARSRTEHSVTLHIHKMASDVALASLVAEHARSFDFIYIDGSHQAPDVLTDAILGFKLLKTGGVMAFDDYLWSEPLPGGVDPIRSPKIAVDAFMNIFCRKMSVIPGALYQLYTRKIAD